MQDKNGQAPPVKYVAVICCQSTHKPSTKASGMSLMDAGLDWPVTMDDMAGSATKEIRTSGGTMTLRPLPLTTAPDLMLKSHMLAFLTEDLLKPGPKVIT